MSCAVLNCARLDYIRPSHARAKGQTAVLSAKMRELIRSVNTHHPELLFELPSSQPSSLHRQGSPTVQISYCRTWIGAEGYGERVYDLHNE